MKYILLIGLLISAFAQAESVVEVSPSGEFQSLEAARDEVRRLKKAGQNPPFKVVVRGGDYVMEEGLFLGKVDSGISFVAADGEKPRFFGGKIIEPAWFKPLQDRRFLSRLVDPKVGKRIRVVDLKKHGITDYGQISHHGWSNEPKDRVPPASLNIGGQRMTLARWPNAGEESPYMVYQHYLPEERPLRGYELKVQEIIEKVRLPGEVTLSNVIDPGGSIRNKESHGGTFEVAFDRMKYWNEAENVWLDGVLGSTWEWTYNRVASVDAAKKQITLAYPELGGVGVGASVRLPHFYFENIPEEIDQPGEYYIDRNNGLLYLYPPKDRGVIVLSSLAEPMVVIANANTIRFQGLEFDTGRNLGLKISKSSDVVVDQCRVANFTAGGVDVDAEKVRIINSHIHGIGAFGVRLRGGKIATLEPADNEVVNCQIHDFGWEQKSQQAGVCAYGVGHRIAHNEIHDATHFGILLRKANDVVIEFNEIHSLPKYHKFDGGSLYVGTGEQPQCRGLVVRNNYFHDVPTIGVYPDNFSWGVEVSHNLFHNVGVKAGRPPIYNNGGGEGRIFNNIAVDCVQLYGQGARPKEERWFDYWNQTLERYGDGKVKETAYNKYDDFKAWLTKKEKEEFFRPRSDIWNNVLYHPHHEIHIDASSLALQQGIFQKRMKEPGVIDHSGNLRSKGNWITQEDPGFVDYANGNFMLRKDATVFKQVKGFEPIPFDQMGRLEKPVL
ncbi:right-handed parallel beta-helix repeat-containing protein [Pontiella desulfatans]|nr:right-handed parallel beta-helix repeat-containing protein [Pontiella desulfatans]